MRIARKELTIAVATATIVAIIAAALWLVLIPAALNHSASAIQSEAQLRAAHDIYSDQVTEMRTQIDHLQQQVQLLRDTLDIFMQTVMAGYREENDALRGELARLYALPGTDASSLVGAVPRPNKDLIERVLTQEAARQLAQNPPQELTYTVISDWGRTPEQAKELGDKVSSLKGQVLAINEVPQSDALEQLGRKLHKAYANYDNINIEVFDDSAAAQRFADTTVSDPTHRVMTISKHAASGRDLILIFNGSEIRTVAPDG